ncbi:MAG: hypothetical protein QF486_04210 [Candidatus Woesearchaeota archaeon]|jgi:hypothetical protein|nr:hypothetical protein [Candidatus Woesearchaeota archaeon]MDP7198796.1 hypothetical protein [Candidatus Woesearchaeota archaeon]
MSQIIWQHLRFADVLVLEEHERTAACTVRDLHARHPRWLIFHKEDTVGALMLLDERGSDLSLAVVSTYVPGWESVAEDLARRGLPYVIDNKAGIDVPEEHSAYIAAPTDVGAVCDWADHALSIARTSAAARKYASGLAEKTASA